MIWEVLEVSARLQKHHVDCYLDTTPNYGYLDFIVIWFLNTWWEAGWIRGLVVLTLKIFEQYFLLFFFFFKPKQHICVYLEE